MENEFEDMTQEEFEDMMYPDADLFEEYTAPEEIIDERLSLFYS